MAEEKREPSSRRRPSLLVLLADDYPAYLLGADGNERISTPNLGAGPLTKEYGLEVKTMVRTAEETAREGEQSRAS